MEQKTAWLPAVIALLCLFATASVHAQPYSIYGTVRVSTTGAPLGGVRMNGLPGVPYTNSDGLYAIGVPAGWTGTVTPSFSGYTFSPPSRTYYNVLSMQPDQNYTATPVTNQWSSDPTVNVPVCTQFRDQQSVRIATDAAGNSIVVWLDKRTSGTTRLYAQRVDATGARNWYPPTGGVSVCTMPSCASPAVISDGGEGAIVVWIDTRAGLPKVYAQRLNRN